MQAESSTRKPTQHRPKGRGNGEGTIYQRLENRNRADGTVYEVERWCTAITLDAGKRKVIYSITRQEVARKLAKTLHDLQEGIHPANDRQTVRSWLQQYVDGLEAQKVAHATLVR